MKSNYKKHIFHTDEEISKYIEEEWEKRSQAVFEDCKRDVIAQLMTCCCIELNKEFGFGKDRLNRFKRGVESVLRLILADGIFGKPLTIENCMQAMEEKYGIDFDNHEEE